MSASQQCPQQEAGMANIHFGPNITHVTWVLESFVSVDQSQPMHTTPRHNAAG
jgi:hypothetical protein